MKKILLLATLVFPATNLLAQIPQSADEKAAPFAVVELFTSEGCSSCPPADKLLGELVANARKNDARIFPLAFHVNYWDRLGWKDPFGSPAFSQRQNQYARAFRSKNLYTPQMIVNGEKEFVGSDRAKSQKFITDALKHQPKVALSLSFPKVEQVLNAIAFAYEISGNEAKDVLNIAIVECRLASAVKRGENAGRTLMHENVVRVFSTMRIESKGKEIVSVKIPPFVDRKNCTLIVYLQNPTTMKILGAASADLPK